MKASGLTGALLDYWVAHNDPRCGGLRFEWRGDHWVGVGTIGDQDTVVIAGSEDGYHHEVKVYKQYRLDSWDSIYSPSTNWSHGGPIIEREGIALSRSGLRWDAETGNAVKVDPPTWVAMCKNSQGRGPAPLIAAMRAFVASKFGDTLPTQEPTT